MKKAIKEVLLTLLIVSAIMASLFCAMGIMSAAQAGATPADDDRNAHTVCEQLNAHGQAITDQGITDIIAEMMRQGLSPDQGAEAMKIGTTKYCAGWQDALVEYFQELNDGEFTINDHWRVVYPSRV